jgi:hypothetical protein
MPARGTQRAALALVVALLLLAPGALAATTAQEGYNAPGGRAQSDVQSQGAAGAVSTTSTSTSARPAGGDSLPFSGMDLAFVVVVGGGLVLLGGGLRRLSGRAPDHDR